MKTRVWSLTSSLLAVLWAAPVGAAEKATPVQPAEKRWAADGPGGEPGFLRHMEPLLGKMGCSGRACHGSFQGAGGFRLSLFSSDPKMDVDALLADRIDPKDPDGSLALLKATKQASHKGGKRFDIDSWQYRLFRAWIAAGAPYRPGQEPRIEKLEVLPSAAILAKEGDRLQLKIVAHYADKTIEDVTTLTQFSTNDDVIAAVTEGGLITAGGKGDTAIVATFAGAVSTAHIIVPEPKAGSFTFPANNRIDDLAADKWRKLGLQPSALADDSEFLRRVYLDLIGTLPTADEARAFLADKDPKKRTKLIDQLLERPEYAMFWATKFSDLTGNDDRFTPQPRPKTARAHRIRQTVYANSRLMIVPSRTICTGRLVGV